jgi:hypothetical protein
MCRAIFLVAVVALLTASLGQPPGFWPDPGFEQLSPGPLTGVRDWEVQRQASGPVLPHLTAFCSRDVRLAHSGSQFLSLSIPREASGFEFLTVGRRTRLSPGREYEASVWVRWTGGPDSAPPAASPVSGHPSAIVSFWARHRDGKGEFAGRDQWLFDNRWQRLAFRFRAVDEAQPVLVYVSLLPNQAPTATTVLVDDFELASRSLPGPAPGAGDGSLAADGGFDRQRPGAASAPWNFAGIGGNTIRGEIEDAGGERYFSMRMNSRTSNYESAQLWQMIDLREGARYRVSCRMRWDNYRPGEPAPIVNYGLFHENSRTWYGPIDQKLEPKSGWQQWSFLHVPPYGGSWKLYVQVNGWGNFGHAVAVSFDDFQLAAEPAQPLSPAPQ